MPSLIRLLCIALTETDLPIIIGLIFLQIKILSSLIDLDQHPMQNRIRFRFPQRKSFLWVAFDVVAQSFVGVKNLRIPTSLASCDKVHNVNIDAFQILECDVSSATLSLEVLDHQSHLLALCNRATF